MCNWWTSFQLSWCVWWKYVCCWGGGTNHEFDNLGGTNLFPLASLESIGAIFTWNPWNPWNHAVPVLQAAGAKRARYSACIGSWPFKTPTQTRQHPAASGKANASWSKKPSVASQKMSMPVSCLIPTKYWYNYIESSILNSMMNASQPFKLGWLNIWVNLNHRIAAGDVKEPDMSSPARSTCSKGIFWMG